MTRDPPDPVRVLHVDDDPDFAELAATFLEREDDRLAVDTATGATEALDRLATDAYDCVVSDYDMPGRNGIEFLEAVREMDPSLPFMLFTGKGSEEVASDAISAGVTDYLQKEAGSDQYAVLANRILNAVEHDRSRRLVERSERRLREIIDSLSHFLFVVDDDGTYLLANEALAAFHDTTVEALEGASVTDVLDEASAERFRRDAEAVRETGESKRISEIELTGATGETRVFEPRLLPYDVTEGDGNAVLGIAIDVTERKERELELQRKERRYAAIFGDPNILVGLIDVDGTVLDVNRTALSYIAADRDDVVGRPFPETAWFDGTPAVRSEVEALIERAADGEYVDFDFDLVDPDGESYAISGVFRPVTDDEGTVVSIFVNSQEITGERRRERELERTNSVLSTLVDTLPVGVLVEDEERNVLTVNRQLIELFGTGRTPAEAVGEDCRELARSVSGLFDDPAEFVEEIEETITTRDDGRTTLSLRDGRTFARTYRRIDLTDGDGHLWVYRDVTERVRRERRLEALHETTQELMTADRCERVAEIGVEAAREILDLEMNSVHLRDGDDSGLVPVAYTEDLADLIGEPPTFTGDGSIAWRSFERGEAFAVDDVRGDPDVYDPDSAMRSELYLPLGQDGILIAGSTRPSAFDEQDLVLGKILAGNLATALEQVSRTQRLRARERELARQNEHLESFANILSHDLRGPLNVAMGQLELMMAEYDSEHLPTVQRSLDRMETLIEDLLTLAREGDTLGEVESVDLAAVVRTCWRTVETGGATLDVRTERTFVADRSRLRQMIENLLRNAVEHGNTADRPSDGPTIVVGDMQDGFYVADDGPGIPPADREAVFDTGYSTASDGTGLGLRIVTRIAGAHGWDVSIAEGADGGTRIEVTGVEDGAVRPPD